MKAFEEKIVKLTLDTDKFKSAAATATTLFDKLKTGIDKIAHSDTGNVAKGIQGIADASGTAESGMQELGEATTGTTSKFSALKTIAMGALMNIGAKLSSMAMTWAKKFTIDPITDGFKEYELKMKSMQTIMTNTGASTQEVNKVLNDLNSYSDLTIYNFNDMTKAIGSLSTSGMKLQDSTAVVKGFFNLAAGTGVEAARASGLLETAMVQAIQIGHMDYQNWKQLQQAGMGGPKFKDALIQNAQAMGKQIDLSEGFNESLKQGWATTDVMLTTMKQFSTDDSLLQAATKVRTFSQLVDTALESVGSIWANSWEVIMGDFDEAGALFSKAWDNISPIIDGLGNLQLTMLKLFKTAGGFSAIFGTIGNVFNFFKNIVVAIGDAWKTSFGRIGDGARALPGLFAIPFKLLEKLTRKISEFKLIPAVIGGAFKMVFSVIGLAASGIFKVVDAVKICINFVQNLKDKFVAAFKAVKWETITEPIKAMGNLIKKITVDPIVKGFKALTSPIAAVKDSLAGWSFDPIKKWFGEFKQGLTEIKDKIKDAFHLLMHPSELLEPVHGIGDKLVKSFNTLKDRIKNIDLFSGVKEKAKEVGDKLHEWLFPKAGQLKNGTVKNITTWGATLGQALESIQSKMNLLNGGKGLKLAFAMPKLDLKGLEESANSKGLVNLAHTIGHVRSNVESLTETMSTAKSVITNAFDKPMTNLLWNLEAGARSAGWSTIANGLERLRETLFSASEKIGDFKDKIVDWFSSMKSFNLAQTIDGWYGSLIKFVEGINWEPLKNGIENVKERFSLFGDVIKTLVTSVPLKQWLERIQNGAQNLIDKIKGINKQKIDNGINKGLETLGTTAEKTQSTFEKFKGVLHTLFSKIGDLALSAGRGVLTGVNLMWDGLKDAFNWIKGHLNIDALKGYADSVANFFTTWGEKIKSTFGNVFSTENLVKGGLLGLLISFIKGAKDTQKSGNKVLDGVAGMFDGFKKIPEMLDQLKESLVGMKKSITPANILAIAGAIAVLAGSLKLMSTIDSNKLGQVITLFATGMAGMVGAIAGLGALNKLKGFSLNKQMGALIGMAGAVLAIAGAMKIFASIEPDDMNRALGAFVATMAILMGSLTILGKTMNGKGISVSLKGITGLATSLIIITSAVQKFASIDTDDLKKGGLAAALSLGALTVVLKVLGNTKFGASSALGVIGVATALNILVPAVRNMGSLSWGEIGRGLTGLGLGLGGITIALKTLNKHAIGSMGAAVAIGMVVAALTALVIPIEILGRMDTGMLVQGLSSLGYALAGISLALGILSQNALGSLAGAASIAAVAGAMNLLIPPVTIFGTMNLATIAQGFGVLGVALGAVVAVGYLATGASVGLMAIATTVGAIGLASVGVAAVIWAVVTALSYFSEQTKDSFDKLLDNILYFMHRVEDAAPEFVSFAETMIDSFCQVIETAIPRVANAGLNIIVGLLQAIRDHIYDITDTAIDIVIEFANAIGDNAQPVIDAAIQLAIDLINGLAHGIDDNADAFFESITRLIGSVLVLLVEGFQQILEVFDIPVISKKGIELGDTAIEGIRSTFNLDTAGSTAQAGMDGFIGGINDNVGGANTAGASAANAANDGLGSADGRSTGKKMGDDFINGTINGTAPANRVGTQASNNTNKGMGSANTNSTGKNLGDKFVFGVGSKSSNARSAGSKLGNNAKSGSRVSGYDSGSYFGSGFVNGIGSWLSNAASKAAALASGALQSLKNRIKQGSPSKLTTESGEFFGEGFFNGIANWVEKAGEKAGDLGQNAVNALGNITDNFRPELEGLVNQQLDLEPLIKPRFDLSGIDNSQFARTYQVLASQSRPVIQNGVKNLGEDKAPAQAPVYNISVEAYGDLPRTTIKRMAKDIQTEIQATDQEELIGRGIAR